MKRTIITSSICMSLFLSCSTDSDSDRPTNVQNLEEASLVDQYQLVKFNVVYENGNTLNNSQLAITGELDISSDSSFTQILRVGANPPTFLSGKITHLKTKSGNKKMGTMSVILNLTGQTKLGSMDYEIRDDTLITITVANKLSDPLGIGFRETDYWKRNP